MVGVGVKRGSIVHLSMCVGLLETVVRTACALAIFRSKSWWPWLPVRSAASGFQLLQLLASCVTLFCLCCTLGHLFCFAFVIRQLPQPRACLFGCCMSLHLGIWGSCQVVYGGWGELMLFVVVDAHCMRSMSLHLGIWGFCHVVYEGWGS